MTLPNTGDSGDFSTPVGGGLSTPVGGGLSTGIGGFSSSPDEFTTSKGGLPLGSTTTPSASFGGGFGTTNGIGAPTLPNTGPYVFVPQSGCTSPI